MKRGRTGCLSIVVAFIVLVVIIAAVAGNKKNSGPTSSPALVTTGTGTAAGTSSTDSPPAQPQTFKGVGTENIGTIDVSVQSTLHWSCSSCANDNFIVSNSFNDSGTIDVNSDGPTSGQTVVDAGTYHDVSINTEGEAWTITIDPGT